MDSSLLLCLGTRCLAGGLGCGRFFLSGLAFGVVADLCRYNTFYILYPIGITSECTLIVQALGPAGDLNPLFQYALVAILVIYVPGMLLDCFHLLFRG